MAKFGIKFFSPCQTLKNLFYYLSHAEIAQHLAKHKAKNKAKPKSAMVRAPESQSVKHAQSTSKDVKEQQSIMPRESTA